MPDSGVVGIGLCQVRGRVLVEGASEGAGEATSASGTTGATGALIVHWRDLVR